MSGRAGSRPLPLPSPPHPPVTTPRVKDISAAISMPYIRLRVHNTYRQLYDRRVCEPRAPLPSIAALIPQEVLQEPHPPRPSLTQPTDYAPQEVPTLEQMPFRPNYKAVMAWTLTDTTLILVVFAIGILFGLLFPPDPDEDDDDDLAIPPPRWEDELTPAVAAAIERNAAQRAARNQRLAEEGYETDREDN
ncbi:hypothetical protein DBV05_g10558 [Lasiodiplodia theobromae]|uniref:Uncharacterized protein n=1 Tax=Lasiodiplodia theobromae TaxID=45133 RepID=A0A5N5CZH7_9PEZI|nr:hypothetical protein DBV05_g10558 [Lasiodiplodia theobromae]